MMKPLPSPVNNVTRGSYTLGVWYDKFTPRVKSHLARDLLHISSAAKGKGVDVYVAVPEEATELANALGIRPAQFVPTDTLWLLYVSDKSSKLPNHKNTRVVYVEPGYSEGQKLRYDPEYPAKLFDTIDGMEVPTSIPWTPPPHTPGSPFQWDF